MKSPKYKPGQLVLHKEIGVCRIDCIAPNGIHVRDIMGQHFVFPPKVIERLPPKSQQKPGSKVPDVKVAPPYYVTPSEN